MQHEHARSHSSQHANPNEKVVYSTVVERCTKGRMTIKSTYSTGPLTPSFARSLALLTHSLAPHCRLRSRALLARSLSHSGAHGIELFIYDLNASISDSFNPTARLTVVISLFSLVQTEIQRLDGVEVRFGDDFCDSLRLLESLLHSLRQLTSGRPRPHSLPASAGAQVARRSLQHRMRMQG